MTYIRTDLLRYRIGIASQEGADVGAILNHAGLDSNFMSEGAEHCDAADERRVWSAIVEITGREDIGLLCGSRFPTQVNGMLGYVMVNSPNLEVALDKCCRYQRLLGDTMGMRVAHEAENSTVHIELWSEWFDTLRYTIDMFMMAALSWTKTNTVGQVQPLSVGFPYERPADTTIYSELFTPATIDFGSANAHLVYDRQSMQAPILGADSSLFEFFDDKVNQSMAKFEGRDTYAHKVRQQILQSLTGGTPAVKDVASTLAVSVRKLQQRLAAEGESFSGLLNNARRDLAMEYLEEGKVNHSEIAYLIGFSEVSVFSRSFKKWTGQTPSEYALHHHSQATSTD